jgi:hypothetical protein
MTSRFKKSNGSAFDTKKFHIAQLKETETADGGALFKGLWGDTQLSLEESSDLPDSNYQNCKALWDFYVERDGVRFRLTQLWECESKNGNTYFSGFLSKSRLTLLASLNGEDDSTWDLFLEEGKKEAEEQEAIRMRAAENAQQPAASPSQKPSIAQELDDEVPF